MWTDSPDIEINHADKSFRIWREIDHIELKYVTLRSHETGKMAIFEFIDKEVSKYRKIYWATKNTVEVIPELEGWIIAFLGRKPDDF